MLCDIFTVFVGQQVAPQLQHESRIDRSRNYLYSYQYVFPILHEENVRLVDYKQLNRGEEVEVSLTFSLGSQHCAETQRRCNNYVC